MNHERAHSQGPTSASTSKTSIPARTQQLIDELRTQCGNWLHEPIRRGLVHFGGRLQELAKNSQSHFDQQLYLKTHQLLQKQREAFDKRFIASIDQAFERLGTQPLKTAGASPLSLSLLDPMEHDLNASLDQLVARSRVRSGPQLIELGYRMAVLLGTPPLESSELPVGPQAMAQAFRDASSTLGMPTAHELLLLQSLESSLIDELASLHELVNEHLHDAGILRGLRPFALPRDPARRTSVKSPATPGPQAETSVGRPAQPVAEENTGPEASTLHSNQADDGIVSDKQLQTALSALQEHFFQNDERARLNLNQPQSLREELLVQLNLGRPTRAKLSPVQRRIVDMIVRLFGKMAQKLPSTLDAQSLLYDLQLPMLRMALLDHAFFDQNDHPARQVLIKITEVARNWFDEARGIPDHDLRIELAQLIARASRQAPSVAVHVSLLNDIEKHLDELQRETQQAENQQVDAMRSLERLEAARARTAKLLAERFAASPSQHRILEHMHHAWSDVMALMLLRHGEGSAAFENYMTVTDQLVGRQPTQDPDKLQHSVQAGLRLIGMPDEQITRVARDMIGERRKPQAANVSQNPVENRVLSTTKSAPSPGVMRVHRHLRELPAGVWFEFSGPSGEQGIRRRLAWYSPLTGHSLFVTRSGQRAQELGEMKLAQAIVSGHIRELSPDRGDDLERALRLVVRELDPKSRSSNHGGA